MNLIPITPATIEMITVLNSGVQPEMEDKETFFVWHGPEYPAEIIDSDSLNEFPEWWTIVKIGYRNMKA